MYAGMLLREAFANFKAKECKSWRKIGKKCKASEPKTYCK